MFRSYTCHIVTCSLLFPFLLCAIVRQYFESGTPFFAFHFPIEHDRGRHDYKMRSPVSFFAGQMRQQCDGLYSFTQTHLVCQNAIQLSVVHSDKPVQSYVLILAKRMFQKERYFSDNLKTNIALINTRKKETQKLYKKSFYNKRNFDEILRSI